VPVVIPLAMGNVIIQSEYTTRNPITMIGTEAGICWGADTSDANKNYKRGLDCLENEHGRAFEFPDIYMILDGLFGQGHPGMVHPHRRCSNKAPGQYQIHRLRAWVRLR